MTIDVWMQHPTLRFLRSDMLASLRRWTGGVIPDTEIPVGATVDLDRPMEAVRELRRRVGEGFAGLRVVPWLWDAPPTDLGLTDEGRRDFLHDNAEPVFRLEADR